VRRFRDREGVPGEQEPALPSGVTQVDAARQAVAGFLAGPPDWPDELRASDAEVDQVEVVELRSGQAPVATAVGVALQWRQGSHLFGLLMPIERLARQAGGLEGVPFYLRLAVIEPHGGSSVGTRTWFTDLPSGPY
jgi:hypothetical protein